MMQTSWQTSATREQVWNVLSEGWLYASWVVGASRIREVDPQWPAVGARLHHSVGSWPLLLNDEIRVVTSRPDRLLRLLASTRPIGEALVEIELSDRTDAAGSTIELREEPISGPARLIAAPVLKAVLLPRNRESLRRLGFLAEGRAR
jgi:hypothetical protein